MAQHIEHEILLTYNTKAVNLQNFTRMQAWSFSSKTNMDLHNTLVQHKKGVISNLKKLDSTTSLTLNIQICKIVFTLGSIISSLTLVYPNVTRT
jgi:hypothetical protein